MHAPYTIILAVYILRIYSHTKKTVPDFPVLFGLTVGDNALAGGVVCTISV